MPCSTPAKIFTGVYLRRPPDATCAQPGLAGYQLLPTEGGGGGEGMSGKMSQVSEKEMMLNSSKHFALHPNQVA